LEFLLKKLIDNVIKGRRSVARLRNEYDPACKLDVENISKNVWMNFKEMKLTCTVWSRWVGVCSAFFTVADVVSLLKWKCCQHS
jgi:hypothetical protein